MNGAVYTQTNEPANKVVSFPRSPDGSLSAPGAYETGGAGDGEPHLASQGSVVSTGDGRHLLVTNTASGDVSTFAITADGGLEFVGRTSTGPAPRSVAEHRGLVYVLATGTPAVSGFRLGEHGLDPIGNAGRPLSPQSDPAQVGFTVDGSALMVTERGTDSITAFPVRADAGLGSPRTIASSGPTPYGFASTSSSTLVVTEAFGAREGAAAASSYSVVGAEITPVTKSVGNGRSEICWAVVTPDGRYAFTTNFADGAVSRYSIADDGQLSLDDPTAAMSVDGRPGLRDESLTPDGRYLYAIDADTGTVLGWGVGADGSLSPIGSWSGLPPTVAGLVSR
ncbi:MAG: lactonase family protein [Actinobacteria bacterium]|nr:lactonase family protein [Actinomycetota bacterium]